MKPQKYPQVTVGHVLIALSALAGGVIAWHPWDQPSPKAEPSVVKVWPEAEGATWCYANDATMSCAYVPRSKPAG